MTSTNYYKSIYTLMLVFIFLTSCKAQSKLPQPKGSIGTLGLSCSMEDASGNLWFGSFGDGLYKFDGKLFVHYGIEQGLNSNTVYSILQDKTGNVWVGTNKGLNRFDGNKIDVISLPSNNNKSSILNNANSNNPASENAVWCMMEDRNGTLWFGTDDAVYCYNGKSFYRFLDNPAISNKNNLQLKAIFSIIEAKDGDIWFAACTSEGVSCFDGKTISVIIPYNEIGRTDQILEDNQNNLWFATAFKGIGKYDGNTYTQNVFKAADLNGSYNILTDAEGKIWFDTPEGLGLYDGKTLTILTTLDGADIKDFIPLLLDKAGNLWFSSKGMKLYKYDGKDLTNYSEE